MFETKSPAFNFTSCTSLTSNKIGFFFKVTKNSLQHAVVTLLHFADVKVIEEVTCPFKDHSKLFYTIFSWKGQILQKTGVLAKEFGVKKHNKYCLPYYIKSTDSVGFRACPAEGKVYM